MIIVARVVRAVGDLRSPRATGAIDRVVARAHDRVDFRILEHRVIEAPSSPRARPRLPPVVARASRDDHAIRLVVEAEDRVALARGMQGFQVSAARALNAIASRRGTVFADRYQITRKR